jgi:hypothetical protein
MSVKSSATIAVNVFLFAGILSATSSRAQDTSAPLLAAQLETQYKLAKMGPDSSVTEAGTVLVIQKDGILGVPPGNDIQCPATYKDGALHPPSVLDRMLCGNDVRKLNVGERVYVTKIDVNSKKDKVFVFIIECDSCNGVTEQASYKASVFFQFPKGYLAGADAGQIEDVISQVFTIDTEPEKTPETPQTAPVPGLTNDDIIKLVQAKLPDSVVIAKIKSSSCDFDTSTDGLIKLKQAGVSDSVLQAVVEAPPSNPPNSGDNPPTASTIKENFPPPSCGDFAACMASGAASLEASQWPQALAKFQGASQLDPSKGEAWAGMGNAYFQMGQYDDAAGMWDKALQLGSSLSISVCHAKALCGDTGTFLLSMKEVSFANKKGEKEFAAAPSAVTSEGAVSLNGARPAYFMKIRFAEKNYRFYYTPKTIRCTLGFICQEPGPTQQQIFANYVHDTLVRMAAGDFGSRPSKP